MAPPPVGTEASRFFFALRFAPGPRALALGLCFSACFESAFFAMAARRLGMRLDVGQLAQRLAPTKIRVVSGSKKKEGQEGREEEKGKKGKKGKKEKRKKGKKEKRKKGKKKEMYARSVDTKNTMKSWRNLFSGCRVAQTRRKAIRIFKGRLRAFLLIFQHRRKLLRQEKASTLLAYFPKGKKGKKSPRAGAAPIAGAFFCLGAWLGGLRPF